MRKKQKAGIDEEIENKEIGEEIVQRGHPELLRFSEMLTLIDFPYIVYFVFLCFSGHF